MAMNSTIKTITAKAGGEGGAAMNAAKKTKNRPAVIYARTSSEDAKDEKLSVPEQFDACEALAEREGYKVVGKFEDRDVSGKTYPSGHPLAKSDEAFQEYCRSHIPRTPKRERPGLAEALASLPRGGVLLVRDKTRFSRPALHSFLKAALVQALRAKGAILHSVDGGIFDPQSHDDAMLDDITSTNEDKGIQMRLRQAKASLDGKADAGMLTNGPTCYGYASAGRQKVVKVPEQAAVVARVYKDYLDGEKSIAAIVRGLNADRIPPSAGGTWGHQVVYNLLRRPAYAGLRKDTTGKLIASVPHAGIAIVDVKDWHRAQARLAERGNYKVRDRGAIHPFSGLLWCAHCGRRLYRAQAGGNKWNRKWGIAPSWVYRCIAPHDGRPQAGEECGRSAVRESVTNRELGGGLMESLAPLAAGALVAMRLDGQSKATPVAVVESISGRIADLERREAKVYDDGAEGVLDARQVATLMARYRAQREEAEKELRAAQAEAIAAADVLDAMPFAKMVLEGKAKPAELRTALRKAIEAVVVGGDEVEVRLTNGQSFKLPRIREKNARLMPTAVLTLPGKVGKDSHVRVTYLLKSYYAAPEGVSEVVLADVGSLSVSVAGR